MVRAYRGIIKEKEALEASFKVLSEMGRGDEGEETEEERGEGEGVDSGVEKSSESGEREGEKESGEREGEKEGGEEGGRQSEAESSEKETVVPEKKVGSLLCVCVCVCVCVIQIPQSLCSSCIIQHCLQLSFNSQLYNNNSSLVFQVIHLYITLYVVHNMHCYCIA